MEKEWLQRLGEGLEGKLARHCLDEIPIALMIHGPEGQLLYSNRKAREDLGYSEDELQFMNILDIDPVVSPGELQRLIEEVCSRRVITFETTHRRKDGRHFPVEITSSLLSHDDRHLAITMAQDITERKKYLEAFQLAQFAYCKSSIATYRSDRHGRIINANEKACASLGYTLEEIRKLNVMDIVANATETKMKSWWHDLIRKKVITFEIFNCRKDGTRFPVEIIANLLEYRDEQFAVSYVRDITEQKAAAEQKARMQAKLRNALRLEALGTLAGGIAHDFRNVLTAIHNYSELTCMKCDDPDSVRRFHEEICKAVDRANRMVSQIHDFSRDNKISKRPVDVGRVVEETLRMMQPTFPDTIRITNESHPDPGIIYADETRIHQAIMNLCVNARNAMSEKGGILRVRVAPVTIGSRDEACSFDLGPGAYLKITVADTGHGMDPNTIERAFDPYFTTSKSRGGAGMGLAIVHGIVKDHGGTIKVASEPGNGTIMTVFLPLAESLPEDPDLAYKLDLPTGSETILLVDDDQPFMDINKTLLEELGYSVATRTDATGALETITLDPNRFDLVMTDYIMPRMKGDWLARQIKEIRPNIPILLFSGFSARINVTDLAKAGISEVLHKPVTFTELAMTVRKMLDRKKP